MILHLLKTDWQRLRWPILGLWLLTLLSALPWLFLTPESFDAPWWSEASGSSSGNLPDEFDGHWPTTWRVSSELVLTAAIGLATAIGMIGTRWQGAMPLGRTTEATAKLLSLLAFIVLPHFVIGLLVVLVMKIPFATAVSAGFDISLSLMVIVAVAAVFGRQCGSGWALVAAIIVLLGAVHVLNEIAIGRFLDIERRIMERGPRLWAAGSLALVGSVLLPKILRLRPGQLSNITVAIISIVLSMVATQRLPAIAMLAPAPGIDATSFETLGVTINPGRIQIRDQRDRRNPEMAIVSAVPTTTGNLPEGTAMIWATVPSHPNSLYSESLLPARSSPPESAALEPLLPAPLAPLNSSIRYADPSIQFKIKKDEFHTGTELTIPLKGHLFRYDEIANLPLSEEIQTQQSEDFTISIRRISDPKRIFVDLFIMGSAKGVARDAVQLTSPEPGAEALQIILYSPTDKVCLQLSQNLKYSSLAPGGARVHRLILSPENWRVLEKLDLTELRVLIYRPVSLALLEREVTVKPLNGLERLADHDWTMARNHRLELPAYLEIHRPRRPDPASTSAEEFTPYLRDVSATWPEENFVSQDLAEFAPQFSELIALHAGRYPAARAIELGTPDSQRAQVIGAIRHDLSNAANLTDVIADRGWQLDAKDTLVKTLQAHTEINSQDERTQAILVATLATLEDSEIYSLLLKSLENTNSMRIYETVRELPGIDQHLDESISRISANLSPDQGYDDIIERRLYDVFDPFQASITHGNREALEKLLERWQLIPKKAPLPAALGRINGLLEAVPAIPKTSEAWDTFLSGKTAADFTHDPLTGKFRASSASE